MIAPEKHLECETMPDAFSGPGDPSSGLLRRYLRRTMIVVPVLALVALLSGPASGLLRRARVLPAADQVYQWGLASRSWTSKDTQ
jgi:hypothetical protein